MVDQETGAISLLPYDGSMTATGRVFSLAGFNVPWPGVAETGRADVGSFSGTHAGFRTGTTCAAAVEAAGVMRVTKIGC